MVSKRLLIYFFLLSFIDLPSLCGLAPFINNDKRRILSGWNNSQDSIRRREEPKMTPEEKEAFYIKQRTEHLNEHKSEEKQLKKDNQFILLFDGTRLTEEERKELRFRPGEMFLRKVISLETNRTIADYMKDNPVKQRVEMTGLKRQGKTTLTSDNLSNAKLKGGDTFLLTLRSQKSFQLKLDISALSDAEKAEMDRLPGNERIQYHIPLYGSQSFSEYLYNHFKEFIERFDTQITEFRKKDSTENISGIVDKQIIAEGDSIVVRLLSREEKDKRELSQIFFSKAFSRDKKGHSQSTISDTFRMNFNLSGLSQEDKILMGFFPGQLFYSVNVPVEGQNDISFYIRNNPDLHTRFKIKMNFIRKKNANKGNPQILENGDSILIHLTSQTGPDETLQTLFPPKTFKVYFDTSALPQDNPLRQNTKPLSFDIPVDGEMNYLSYLWDKNKRFSEEMKTLLKNYDTGLVTHRKYKAKKDFEGSIFREKLKPGDSITFKMRPKTPDIFLINFDLSQLNQSEREKLPLTIVMGVHIEGKQTLTDYLQKNSHWLDNYTARVSNIRRKRNDLSHETPLINDDLVNIFLTSKGEVQPEKRIPTPMDVGFNDRTSAQRESMYNYFSTKENVTRVIRRENGIRVLFKDIEIPPPDQSFGKFQIHLDMSHLAASAETLLRLPLKQSVHMIEENNNILFYLERNGLSEKYDIEISEKSNAGQKSASGTLSQDIVKDNDVITVILKSKKRLKPKKNLDTFKLHFNVSGLTQRERESLSIRLEQDIPVESDMSILYYLNKNSQLLIDYDVTLSDILHEGGMTSSQIPSQAILNKGDTITVFLASKEKEEVEVEVGTSPGLEIKYDVRGYTKEKRDSLARDLQNTKTVDNVLQRKDHISVFLKPPGTFQLRYDVSALSESEKGKVPVLLEQNVLLEHGGDNALFYLEKNLELLINYNVGVLYLQGNRAEMPLRSGDVATVRINSRKKTEHGSLPSRGEQFIAAAKAEGKQVLQIFMGAGQPYYLKIDLNNPGKYWKPGDLFRIQIVSESDHSGILAKSA